MRKAARQGWRGGKRNKIRLLNTDTALAQEMCKLQIASVWESICGWIMLLSSLLLSLGTCSGCCQEQTLHWRDVWLDPCSYSAPAPRFPSCLRLVDLSFGSILSEFCVYFNHFDIVTRGSGEAVSASMKGHPQSLPNLSHTHFQTQKQSGKSDW